VDLAAQAHFPEAASEAFERAGAVAPAMKDDDHGLLQVPVAGGSRSRSGCMGRGRIRPVDVTVEPACRRTAVNGKTRNRVQSPTPERHAQPGLPHGPAGPGARIPAGTVAVRGRPRPSGRGDAAGNSRGATTGGAPAF